MTKDGIPGFPGSLPGDYHRGSYRTFRLMHRRESMHRDVKAEGT